MFIANRQPQPGESTHRGFTLVEILIAIVIITILIGLLMPAISGVRMRARITQVKADIADLETAITQFKVTYGVEPPSRITLYPPNSAALWQADPRSLGFIRRMWPQFNIASSGGAAAWPTAVTLNGSECLVFFLGGVRDGARLVGFSKNPLTPFAVGGNREGPFYDFDGAYDTTTSTSRWTGRFVDVNGNGAPEYVDAFPGQTMPYVYISGYDGRGYRVEVNPTPPPTWRNTDGLPAMPYAYYQTFDATDPSASAPYNANKYQIISPGPDMQYGTGGLFDPDNGSALSTADRDNITNFHGGMLGR